MEKVATVLGLVAVMLGGCALPPPSKPAKDRTVRLFVAEDVDVTPAVDWLENVGVDCLVVLPLSEHTINEDPKALHIEVYREAGMPNEGRANIDHDMENGRARISPTSENPSLLAHELTHVIADIWDAEHDEDPDSLFNGHVRHDTWHVEPETEQRLLDRACWTGVY